MYIPGNVKMWEDQNLVQDSGGLRGGSGCSLEPPPRPLFLNIL